MPKTIIPFRETKARSTQLHVGPYYRWAVRRVIQPPPQVRSDIRYFWLIVVFGSICAMALGFLISI